MQRRDVEATKKISVQCIVKAMARPEKFLEMEEQPLVKLKEKKKG